MASLVISLVTVVPWYQWYRPLVTNISFVRDSPNCTINKFTIGSYWYQWLPENPERFSADNWCKYTIQFP